MKIKKGDIVRVITGTYKGKQGKVLKVEPDKYRCIMEGVNFRIKHQRAVSPQEPGGRQKKEGPIHISNLKLICPKCGQSTRIGGKSIANKNVRVCKKCGEMLDV